MKIKTIGTICLIIICKSLFAQIKFEKQINSRFAGSTGNYVVQTSDEGYLGLGDFLFRTDKFGDTLWTKKIFDKGYSIAPLPNDEFSLSGEIGGICTVVKIDNKGKQLWLKKFELADIEQYWSKGIQIISTADNNCLVINERYIIKISGAGDTLWTFKQSNKPFTSIKEINGYYYAKTNSGTLYKLTVSGKLIWAKYYGNASIDKYYGGGDVVRLPDGNILLLYSTYPADGLLVFIKINSEGDTIWSKTTKEYIMNNMTPLEFSVAISKDGIFVLSSTSDIIQYDFNGNMLWKKTFPITSLSNDIHVTKDGGLVLLGNSPDLKLLLIKVTPELLGSFITTLQWEKNNFYPNPFSDYTTLILNDTYADLELTLISSIGKVQKKIYDKRTKYLVIEKENLIRGIYIYELKDGNRILSRGKISVE